MSNLGIGSNIGQLNQSFDENIKIKSNQGKFNSVEEAQKKALDVAKNDNEDAVIVKTEDNKYEVFGVDEVGKLDPTGNDKAGEYKIHDTDANVLNFVTTQRNEKGVKTGGEKNVSSGRNDLIIKDAPSEIYEKLKVLDTDNDGRVSMDEVKNLKMMVKTNQITVKEAREALSAAQLLMSTKELGGKVEGIADSKTLGKARTEVVEHFANKTSHQDNLDHAQEALSYTLNQNIAAANKYRGVSEGARSTLALAPNALARIVAGTARSGVDSLEAAESAASVAKTMGYGNCQEQACVAAVRLKEKGVQNVEVMGKPNHAFVVIGRDPKSDASDPSTWGDKAVVCDPWYEEHYSAKELPNHQNNNGVNPSTFVVVKMN
jgi:hypothetical protein